MNHRLALSARGWKIPPHSLRIATIAMPPLPRIRFLCASLLLAPVLIGGLSAEPSVIPWDEYLKEHPLKVEECLAQPPSDLFHLIAGRDHVSLYGSPSGDATMIDAFYAQYTRELSAYNDKHFPERVTSRPALRELFYFVVEGLRDGYGERSYIDRERIDAYVEHLIATVPAKGFLPGATELAFSADQAANHARERLAKVALEPYNIPQCLPDRRGHAHSSR